MGICVFGWLSCTFCFLYCSFCEFTHTLNPLRKFGNMPKACLNAQNTHTDTHTQRNLSLLSLSLLSPFSLSSLCFLSLFSLLSLSLLSPFSLSSLSFLSLFSLLSLSLLSPFSLSLSPFSLSLSLSL